MTTLRSNENKANLQSLIEKTCVIYKEGNITMMHRDGSFYNEFDEHELYEWKNRKYNEYNSLKSAKELRKAFDALTPQRQLNIRYVLNWF